MIILDRKAYAVDFSPFIPNLLKVSVELKEGDCRRVYHPDYQCTENCDGLFMEVGVHNDGPGLIFIPNALMRRYEYIEPEISDGYRTRDFRHFEMLFEDLSKIHGHLRLVRQPGEKIYMRGEETIGRKMECGLNGDMKAFSEEAMLTLSSVIVNLPTLLVDMRKMTTREKIREAYEMALEHPETWEAIRDRFLGDPEFISCFQQYMMERRKN